MNSKLSKRETERLDALIPEYNALSKEYHEILAFLEEYTLKLGKEGVQAKTKAIIQRMDEIKPKVLALREKSGIK